jgi:AP2 domain
MTLIPNTRMIPLTRGKSAIVDEVDYEPLSQWRWYAKAQRCGFYAYRRGAKSLHGPTHIGMARQLLGLTNPKIFAEHKNGNGLDNRRANIRPATAKQNAANTSKQRNNTSGFKGVWWRGNRQKWVAQIVVGGKSVYLGSFSRPQDASREYNAKAIELHGEFARVECL